MREYLAAALCYLVDVRIEGSVVYGISLTSFNPSGHVFVIGIQHYFAQVHLQRIQSNPRVQKFYVSLKKTSVMCHPHLRNVGCQRPKILHVDVEYL